MKTKISLLATDLAKGSFQVRAERPDGAVLSNRAMSRSRLAALLAAIYLAQIANLTEVIERLAAELEAATKNR